MSSNQLILCAPLLFLPSIFSSIRVFSRESVLTSGVQNIGVSASASVLLMNIQDWFPLGFDLLTVQGTLKSFLAPQFKTINSSVLNFPYGPTLTSIHDYWKNILEVKWSWNDLNMKYYIKHSSYKALAVQDYFCVTWLRTMTWFMKHEFWWWYLYMNEEILIDDSKCQELLFNSLKYNWFIILVLDIQHSASIFL